MASVEGSGLELTPVPPAPVLDVRAERRRRRRELLRALVRSKTFIVGAAILIFSVVDAIFWRAIVPHDPLRVAPIGTLKAPSSAHWFGTDNLGRDVFPRVLPGAATDLAIAPAAPAPGLVRG